MSFKHSTMSHYCQDGTSTIFHVIKIHRFKYEFNSISITYWYILHKENFQIENLIGISASMSVCLCKYVFALACACMCN